MAIITLRLAPVNSHPTARPSQCRFCGHALLQKWGTVTKPVRDSQLRTVLVHRYHCPACQRTFRHYPTGIERPDQSRRLQQLAALCWQFGFSTRNVGGLFNAFGIALAHMTVWRDMQQRATALCQTKPRPALRVLGVDGVYGRVAGHPHVATLAVDSGTGQLITLAHAFKIRGGSPTETGEYGGTPGKAAGTGYLGSDELAFTIAASQDQQIAYRKVRRAKSADDFETWKRDEVMNCFDQGDVRAVNVVLTSFGFLPTQGSKAHGLGIEQELSPTLNSGCDAYGVYQEPIAVDTFNQTVNEHTSQTLGSSATDVNHYGAVMMPPMAIRRLTPLECERLQGFPDNWTLIPWKNKPIEDCPDGPRYKACGNSMAVPCMRWTGQRINDAKAELF